MQAARLDFRNWFVCLSDSRTGTKEEAARRRGEQQAGNKHGGTDGERRSVQTEVETERLHDVEESREIWSKYQN